MLAAKIKLSGALDKTKHKQSNQRKSEVCEEERFQRRERWEKGIVQMAKVYCVCDIEEFLGM